MATTDTTSELQVVIPMAGSGERFKRAGFTDPKPMIDVAGKSMIHRSVETLGLEGRYTFICAHYEGVEANRQIYATLRRLRRDCTIVQLFEKTDGPVATCMHARKHLDPEAPLLITNCDQVLEWDASAFLDVAMNGDADGLVVVYNARTKKNSYIQLDEQKCGIRLAEKEVLPGNHSLNGVHFWKKARYFFESAQRMMEADVRVNGEFYIAPTYNEMIGQGLRVRAYEIPKNQHHAIGTPGDLKKFLRLLEKRDADHKTG